MDIISLLKADHKKVKKLLTELEETTGRATKARKKLLLEVKIDLTLHEELEENVFYSSFDNDPKLKVFYLQQLEEHNLIDNLFSEIENYDTKSYEWKARFNTLKSNILSHAEMEEKNVFPAAKKLLGVKRLKELGNLYKQMKFEKQI